MLKDGLFDHNTFDDKKAFFFILSRKQGEKSGERDDKGWFSYAHTHGAYIRW